MAAGRVVEGGVGTRRMQGGAPSNLIKAIFMQLKKLKPHVIGSFLEI